MNRYKLLSFIFLLSLFAACSGDSSVKNRLQESLNYNYAKWRAKQVELYSITYQRDCLCEPSYHSSLIQNGQVLNSWNELTHSFENQDELYRFTSIEYLFETLQFAIDYGADAIYVDFDEQFGFPRVLEIEFDAGFDGDYIAYEIEEFNASNYVDSQYYLEIAQQNWESDFLSDYRFTLEISCLCELHGDVLDVTVQGGVVVSASDSLGNNLSAQELLLVPTVANLFTEVAMAIDGEAADLLVEFDPLWGYPLSLSINTTPQFVDDEFTYMLSNMQINHTVANQNKIDFYKALWETEKPSAYHYLLWSPELDDAYQYHVDVLNDVGVEGHFLNAYGEWQTFDLLTLNAVLIEDYFAIVEDALAQNADILIVYYDSQFGYPTEIYVDYDETLAGDEEDYYLRITR